MFLVLAALTALVPAVTAFVDRRFGNKLAPTPRRVLRRMVIFTYRTTAQGVLSPIFVPLITNVGRKKMMAIFYFSLFSILVFVIAERFARTEQLSINSYDYFAASDRFGVDYRFYENQRSADEIYP